MRKALATAGMLAASAFKPGTFGKTADRTRSDRHMPLVISVMGLPAFSVSWGLRARKAKIAENILKTDVE
ncbi:MAG: hypothetical protein AAGF82_13230 [Pseudomonadota bacterium]